MNEHADKLNREAIQSYGSGLVDEAIRLWREAFLTRRDRLVFVTCVAVAAIVVDLVDRRSVAFETLRVHCRDHFL